MEPIPAFLTEWTEAERTGDVATPGAPPLPPSAGPPPEARP